MPPDQDDHIPGAGEPRTFWSKAATASSGAKTAGKKAKKPPTMLHMIYQAALNAQKEEGIPSKALRDWIKDKYQDIERYTFVTCFNRNLKKAVDLHLLAKTDGGKKGTMEKFKLLEPVQSLSKLDKRIKAATANRKNKKLSKKRPLSTRIGDSSKIDHLPNLDCLAFRKQLIGDQNLVDSDRNHSSDIFSHNSIQDFMEKSSYLPTPESSKFKAAWLDSSGDDTREKPLTKKNSLKKKGKKDAKEILSLEQNEKPKKTKKKKSALTASKGKQSFDEEIVSSPSQAVKKTRKAKISKARYGDE